MKGRRLAIFLLPLAFVVLAAVGTARSYSATPFWDMWDGYLDFFMRVSDGEVSRWWGFHNEHRLILSRLLFWVDLAWLDQGRTPFLVIVNLLLAGAIVGVLIRYLDALQLDALGPTGRAAMIGLFIVLAFSWAQQENFPWGFQSQFFLVQLLPLVAFLATARAMQHEAPASRWRSLLLAAVAGFASIGTMANGMLAMPLVVVLAVATRRVRRPELIFLAGVALLALVLARVGYVAPAGQTNPLTALLSQPVEAMQFVFRYLGLPMHFAVHAMFETHPAVAVHSPAAAGLTGALVVLVCGILAFRVLRTRRPVPVEVALLAYAGFVMASAAATAGGRLALGLDAALASRYATPVLCLWSVLGLLLASQCRTMLVTRPVWLPVTVVVLALVLLPLQWFAVKVDRGIAHARDVGGLAIQLGVRDAEFVRLVYPDVTVVLDIGQRASERGLSIFGSPALQPTSSADAARAIEASAACNGHLDGVADLATDPRFIRIRGWLFDPATRSVPVAIHMLDRDHLPMGQAQAGGIRPDVAASIDRKASYSGFIGYVRRDRLVGTAWLLGLGPACRLSVQ